MDKEHILNEVTNLIWHITNISIKNKRESEREVAKGLNGYTHMVFAKQMDAIRDRLVILKNYLKLEEE